MDTRACIRANLLVVGALMSSSSRSGEVGAEESLIEANCVRDVPRKNTTTQCRISVLCFCFEKDLIYESQFYSKLLSE